jgi:hypothetical protein
MTDTTPHTSRDSTTTRKKTRRDRDPATMPVKKRIKIRTRLPAAAAVAPVGRPPEYKPEYCELAYRLTLLGLDDDEVAAGIGLAPGYYYEWLKKYPELAEARARGKEIADGEVVQRLYKRAIGYSHEAVKIFMPAGASEPVYAKYIEHFPPDVQAATWWLKNRRPKQWKDRTETEVSGQIGLGVIEIPRKDYGPSSGGSGGGSSGAGSGGLIGGPSGA